MSEESTTGRDYLSEAQQVALTLLTALLDTWPEPQTPTMLARRTSFSRDQCYRGLKNLEAARFAEDGPAGWLVGPAVTLSAERIRQRTAALLERHLGRAA